MNRERTAQAAAVMLAFAEGKTIQSRKKPGECVNCETVWHDVHPAAEPLWCWTTHDFRVKPAVVCSRRYIYEVQSRKEFVVGTVSASVATDALRRMESAMAVPGLRFVRWIDMDWVETEL